MKIKQSYHGQHWLRAAKVSLTRIGCLSYCNNKLGLRSVRKKWVREDFCSLGISSWRVKSLSRTTEPQIWLLCEQQWELPREPHLVITLFKSSKWSLMRKQSNSFPVPGQGDSRLLAAHISMEPCDWVLALSLYRNSFIRLHKRLRAKDCSLPLSWWKHICLFHFLPSFPFSVEDGASQTH